MDERRRGPAGIRSDGGCHVSFGCGQHYSPSSSSSSLTISLVGAIIGGRGGVGVAYLSLLSYLLSATEIVDVAFYYFASSSLHVCLLVREKMCWWLALARKKMWRWIASFGESYHGDVLQFAGEAPIIGLFGGKMMMCWHVLQLLKEYFQHNAQSE